jgi:hypothetical protein
MRVTCIALLCVLFAGCSPIEPPEPAESHPANPSATSGPRRRLSSVLDVDEANLPTRPPEMGSSQETNHGMSRRPMPPDDDDDRGKQPAPQVYTCAMHPKVRQPRPGRCPICHMELISSPTGPRGDQ